MRRQKIWLIFIFFSLLIFTCADKKTKSTPTAGNGARTGPATLTAGELKAVFIDNSAFGENHRAGYNGIAELYHTAQESSLFVPFYAGFNIEHIFAGDSLHELFEPRRHPMHLKRIDERSVLLHQPETPLSRVENWTTFTMTPPHYIDIDFQCVFHSAEFFQHGYAGLFWASYIHAPPDKKIYFYGREKTNAKFQWHAGWSPEHGLKSTHLGKNDSLHLFMALNFNITLANDFSDLLFEKPFYYGRFHNMVFAQLFHVTKEGIIRFSQSPTGGGADNPAWDFQFIIPEFEIKKTYAFSARLIYKEFISAGDIAAEYESWTQSDTVN